jgi:phosphate transport system permease protein
MTPDANTARIQRIIARRRRHDRIFCAIGLMLLVICLGTLAALLGDLAVDGWARINKQFLTSFPSRFPARAGILSAWVGTLLVSLVTACTAIPLGLAAGIYLEEYSARNRIARILEINLHNLAGVPSIIYGLLALGLFVYVFQFGRSILTAGLTLGILILPIVIVATREALRAIPLTIREASYALGATKWQTVRHHLLPYSMGGIFTGIIIAISRAIGETAPLVTIGALTFIAFLPPSPIRPEPPFLSAEWLKSDFTVLPIQMFNWVSRPQREFHINAAATGLVLIVVTLLLNMAAVALRYRARKRVRW